MRKRNYKGRCEKRVLSKCDGVCKTYSDLQYAYADILEAQSDIKEIRCNVPLTGLSTGDYVSDFVCIKENGEMMVREGIMRTALTKPMTVKLLDSSRVYWLNRGVTDWGLVIDAEK